VDISKLQEPLKVHELDFRIQSINKGGYATILAYKNARVDINRLNSICGRLGWERSHSRDNRNCTVSIWDDEKSHWVSKEDTGKESIAEAQKGLASDSFKRACFNWGIGIELYDFPVIQVKLTPKEFKVDGDKAKATWELKLKEWTWFLRSGEGGEVCQLAVRDNSGNVRFNYKLENKETA